MTNQNQKVSDSPLELTMLQRIWLWLRLEYSCEVPLTRAAYHPPLDDGRRNRHARHFVGQEFSIPQRHQWPDPRDNRDPDVLDLAEPVLKHRMALTFTARAEGESIEAVVGRLKSRIG